MPARTYPPLISPLGEESDLDRRFDGLSTPYVVSSGYGRSQI